MDEKLGVSPNYELRGGSADKVFDKRDGRELLACDVTTKIEVYEDRVTGWFLTHIDALKDLPHSGYARLSLAISQIEGNEQLRRGVASRPNESGEFFKTAANRIFGLSETVAELLWKSVRCGLLHDGFTRGPVFIDDSSPAPTNYSPATQVLVINTNRFAQSVASDIRDYCKQLREGRSDLVQTFETMWDLAWQNSKTIWFNLS